MGAKSSSDTATSSSARRVVMVQVNNIGFSAEPGSGEIPSRGEGSAYARQVAPTLGTFLQPEGFDRPALASALREGSVVGEAGRHLVWAAGQRRHRRATPY